MKEGPKHPTLQRTFNLKVHSQPKLSTAKQAEPDDALMQLLIGKALPLSLVDHPSFRKFIGLLNSGYVVPSRATMQSKLQRKNEEVTKKIKGDISACHDLAITHDGWTSNNTESYSTVTGHFITND